MKNIERAILTIAILIVAQSAFAQGAKPVQGNYPQPAKDSKAQNELKDAEAGYKKAKDAFTKSKSKSNQSTYVKATVKYGTASMVSPILDRKIKYKQALQLYREALKFEPNNKEASSNKKMIEDIYKSMGRPIPN